ncbi:YL1_C domain-containing protein [Meloidogyne graminicola]|uniref:Vacuolar protein sorting-associated protein 72 homolog n=1 Tax=Meloidogyne graminicola TaxID=189291 RepID=A0A8S9ZDV0_9BILA|nr:YL1_C domain-containing protein [Meloidogyne graminicola]
MLERDKNWAIARINKMSVPENSCDPKTQRQRLEEAKNTAKQNIASLKRFEQFELERKKRQQKTIPRQKLEGPRIKELFTADGKHLLLVPELLSKEQLFPRPKKREYKVCSVTGRHARYMDPITKLPYADIHAFKIIRDAYKKFIDSELDSTIDCKKIKL